MPGCQELSEETLASDMTAVSCFKEEEDGHLGAENTTTDSQSHSHVLPRARGKVAT